MPSKPKKQSKSTPPHSKLSYSNRSPSPSSSLSNPKYSIEEEEEEAVSEETLRQSLEQASRKFPSLISIGETTPFIGQLISVVDNGKFKSRCVIWISEPSMTKASIVPGSIVSVSLASIRNGCSSSFPLSSLIDECARNIGIDTRDSMTNQSGNYFALATIFPSCKVLNNDVQLSSSLSYTMGSPSAGRYIFVNPIQNQQLAGNGIDKPLTDGANCLSSHSCKELYLEFVPSENGVTTKTNVLSSTKSKETNNDVHRNQISSSPRTPLFQQKHFSSKSSELTPSISASSTSNSHKYKNTLLDSVDIRHILGDESSRKLLQTCATSWLSSRSLICGNLIAIPILLDICIFQVRGFNRALADNIIQDNVDHVNDAFVVDNETNVYLSLPSYLELEAPGNSPLFNFKHEDIKAKVSVDLSKLGGLSKEYATLKRIIISSIVKDPLSRFGVQPTKGVLLHGPPGTGKTTLAQLCAHDAGVNVFSVNGPEIARQYDGESEKALHEVFESASQAAPAVVFIDELDAIAPSRKDGGEELSQRLVCTLLTIMDGICRTDGVFVIAATNRPDSIEPALRRPGRLDQEIEIGVPSPKQRLDILVKLLSQMKHSLSDAQVQQLALTTHGFVGADLVSLCKEANYVLLRKWHYAHSNDTDALLSKDHSGLRYSSKSDLPRTSERTARESTDVIQNGHRDSVNEMCELGDHMLIVTYEDFEKAKIKVKPSAMREVILEVPRVNWEDVGGQKEVKAQLKEAVEWPQKHPEVFERIGTSPPRGVLLFGPPGCSKTLMARAVASEAGFNFFSVKGPELFSKYVGESEKAVKALFAKARANAPSIIFFDEIDGLAVIRGKESDGVSVADRVMSQLLVEMDGFHQRVNVIVIAATNRPDKIDPALLRAGRFDRLLYVGLPNESDREDIFRIHLRKSPCNSDVSIKELASLTEGFSGADISSVRWKAAVAAIEESFEASEIKMKHLTTAIKQIQPSEIPSYQELSANFQRFVKLDTSTTTRDGERANLSQA